MMIYMTVKAQLEPFTCKKAVVNSLKNWIFTIFIAVNLSELLNIQFLGA